MVDLLEQQLKQQLKHWYDKEIKWFCSSNYIYERSSKSQKPKLTNLIHTPPAPSSMEFLRLAGKLCKK